MWDPGEVSVCPLGQLDGQQVADEGEHIDDPLKEKSLICDFFDLLWGNCEIRVILLIYETKQNEI